MILSAWAACSIAKNMSMWQQKFSRVRHDSHKIFTILLKFGETNICGGPSRLDLSLNTMPYASCLVPTELSAPVVSAASSAFRHVYLANLIEKSRGSPFLVDAQGIHQLIHKIWVPLAASASTEDQKKPHQVREMRRRWRVRGIKLSLEHTIRRRRAVL